MSEIIDIVMRESGTEGVAANIAQVGTASSVSDKALSDLLTRAGTAGVGLQSLAVASGSAATSLMQTQSSATGTAAALANASTSAGNASSTLNVVGLASTEAAAGMSRAGTAGTEMALAMREAASAAQLASVAETEVGAAGTRAAVGMSAAGAAATRGAANVKHMSEESGVLQNKMERLQVALVAMGLALGVHELIEVADTWANMSNQLQRVSVSAEDFGAKQEHIFQMAQISRQPLESINSLYVGMSQALRNVGVTGPQTERAIETLAEAATISGKSVSETKSAIERLGISMREGEINGRGFLQFLVQMPEVGERVAVALGFVGKDGFANFVKAAGAGEISSKKFVLALNEISPAVDREMNGMRVTIDSAMVTVKNAFTQYIGRADDANGASDRVAKFLIILAKNIDVVVGVIGILTAAIGAYGFAVGIAALASGALALSFAVIVGILAAAAAAVFFFGSAVKITSDGSVTLWSLIAGAIVTVYNNLKTLVTWMTTTTSGAVVLYGVLGTLAVVLAKLSFDTIIASLIKLGTVFLGLLAPAALLIAALAALVVEYFAVRFATVALSQGLDAAKSDLASMTDTITKMGKDLKSQFTDNVLATSPALKGMQTDMSDTGTYADKLGVSIVKAGQATNQSFRDMSDAGKNSSVNIVNAMDGAHGAVQKLANGTKSASGSVATDMKKMADSTKPVSDGFDEVGQHAKASGLMVENAMGEMVKAESVWAANSGAYFNSVAKDAASTASSIASMNNSMGGGNYPGAMGGNVAPSASGFSDGWGISDVSRGSGSGISSLSQSFSKFADGGEFVVGGHGGTDTSMVQFLATPGERVTIETPGQAKSKRDGNSGSYANNSQPIIVKMTVNTPDANSFRLNQTQLTTQLANKLRRVQGQLGG